MATAAYPIESVFSAYRRSDDGALRERRDDLFAARKDELAEARPLVAVAARRVAAVAGGATAAAGAAILVGLAIGRALIERPREGGGSLTLALLGGVAASLAVWGATRVGAQALLGARLARDITVSDDPRRDLPRLEQAEVVARAVRWARRFPVAATAETAEQRRQRRSPRRSHPPHQPPSLVGIRQRPRLRSLQRRHQISQR